MKRWFHPAFEIELLGAAVYLDQQRSGSGRQFVDDIEAAIERIMQAPATWRMWHMDFRRYLLPRFQYTIRYRIRHDEDWWNF